jgi:hypothetical protein
MLREPTSNVVLGAFSPVVVHRLHCDIPASPMQSAVLSTPRRCMNETSHCMGLQDPDPCPREVLSALLSAVPSSLQPRLVLSTLCSSAAPAESPDYDYQLPFCMQRAVPRPCYLCHAPVNSAPLLQRTVPRSCYLCHAPVLRPFAPLHELCLSLLSSPRLASPHRHRYRYPCRLAPHRHCTRTRTIAICAVSLVFCARR